MKTSQNFIIKMNDNNFYKNQICDKKIIKLRGRKATIEKKCQKCNSDKIDTRIKKCKECFHHEFVCKCKKCLMWIPNGSYRRHYDSCEKISRSIRKMNIENILNIEKVNNIYNILSVDSYIRENMFIVNVENIQKKQTKEFLKANLIIRLNNRNHRYIVLYENVKFEREGIRIILKFEKIKNGNYEFFFVENPHVIISNVLEFYQIC